MILKHIKSSEFIEEAFLKSHFSKMNSPGSLLPSLKDNKLYRNAFQVYQRTGLLYRKEQPFS